MSAVAIEAEKRELTGSRNIRRLRREGKVPGVFYMGGNEAVHILLDGAAVQYFISHGRGLIELSIKGEKEVRPCVLRDVQYHPITEDVLHLDFLGVTAGEELELEVPLSFTGKAPGVKDGGIVEHLIREVRVRCLPRHIPENLEVDISELGVGDTIQIKDLIFENVTILEDPEETVALCEIPRMAEEPEEGEELEDEMVEPEVIGEKSDDDEDDEG